jgi:hypothetical protein
MLEVQDENTLKVGDQSAACVAQGMAMDKGCSDLRVSKVSGAEKLATAHLQRGRVHHRESAGAA